MSPPVPGTAVIELKAAEKRFPNGVVGLSPLDLLIEAGDFITLIGPSGCGKSTLLKLLANLHEASSGKVHWWGDDFSSVGTQGRRLALVPQDATLMPWSTVYKNVRLPLDFQRVPHAEADTRVRDALSRVGLGKVGNRLPRELSGGMKMRVSIARALVIRPDLLLMDEPFGALDDFTRNRLDEEMAQLCYRDGLTTVFVTHSLYEAAFLSSKIIVMAANPGRIFAQYDIDRTIIRDDAFRLSDKFSEICRDLTHLLGEATQASLSHDHQDGWGAEARP